MRRENWTYKKFEDCIEKVKYTEKIPSNNYLVEGKYPIISQEEGLISGYWNQSKDVFHIERPLVIFGDHTRVLKYVDFDFVLGADGVKILLPIKELDAKFFLYYLQWCKIPSLGYSRHYKLLKDYSIPVPSLSEQEAIVAELDRIQAIISAKNAQLSELDSLAQAIFYEMFGDPITNPKGWEVKKIGEVATFINGKAHEQDIDKEGAYILINSKYIASNGLVYKRTNSQIEPLYKNDIVMVMSDVPNGRAIAKCLLILEDGKYSLNQRICAFRNYKSLPEYLLYSLNRHSYYLSFDNGDSQTNLRKSDVLGCPIMLPPLSLQEEFAKKVGAIEKQKELIRASVKEFESLMEQRMEYYFG